jgi:1-acyl-sn-glycerol-3-phosphate acyltransferase
MTRIKASSRMRHELWRLVCTLSGGLTVRGPRPRAGSGAVLVANHSSHADTAALLAALPPATQPVFAAAADYWFDVALRRFLVTNLAGALPVRRGAAGTYAALRSAAEAVLTQGRIVIIYPEGSRSIDGQIGAFHSGALRLARDCGVPVIPVALIGTGEVLPKHGRWQPSRMQVRFGAPVDPHVVDCAQLRSQVIALRDNALAAYHR